MGRVRSRRWRKFGRRSTTRSRPTEKLDVTMLEEDGALSMWNGPGTFPSQLARQCPRLYLLETQMPEPLDHPR